MKSALTVVLFLLFTIGVFVDGKEASNVSVMEGDSVTLKSGVTDVQKKYTFEWRFNGIRIDKFEDGLQLDSQIGDLKISNIRTTDSGLYKVKISSTRGSPPEMEFNVTVVSADEVKTVSVMEGDSVTLRTDVPDIHRVDEIRWRFGKQKSLVAKINRIDEIFNKLDGPDERFRDRLELDNQTGSLIITDIRTEHTGLYEAEISSTRSRYTIHYTQSFSVTGRGEMKTVSGKEGGSVTLQIVTEIQSDDDLIEWKFGNINLAEFNKTGQRFHTYDGPDERFRDRLDLDHQTGSLIIPNTRTTDSRDYELKITSSRHIINRIITVTVSDEVMSVMKGNRVTLNTGVTKNPDDTLLWYFENTLIALINGHPEDSCLYYGEGEIFKDRLEVDHKTGSLIITNITSEHTGRYEAEFIKHDNTGKTETIIMSSKCDPTKINPKRSDLVIHKSFSLTVSDEVMSVMKGNRVTLNTGVTKNPGDVFLWYFEYTLIALVSGHPDTSCLYYGEGEKFKDRLEVDYATGSLTIKTSRPEHTGRYQAEFFEGKPGKTETIIMSSKCDHTKIYPKGSDLVIQKSFILIVSDSGVQSGSDLQSGSGAVAWIVAAVAVVLLLAAVVGVMYYRRKNSDLERQIRNRNTQNTATEETKLNEP